LTTALEARVENIVSRVRGEFIEMPGLKLTFAQAQRLWGLARSTCEAVIDRLIESPFPVWARDGALLIRSLP
jgi:hypothetical protein